MGKVVVAVIAFAILSFILADLLGPNSVLLGGNNTDVGEIAGQTVSYEEYNQVVEQYAANYAANFGRNPSEREMVTLRNQAWDRLIVDKAYTKEYAAIGLEVSNEEMVDMVQGKNITPQITSAPDFANPQTGQFDREQLALFLQNFDQLPPNVQISWLSFENELKTSRYRIKLDNLLAKSEYVTEEEARREYLSQASSADIKFIYVPFSSVPDSLISVTDSDLNNYISQNSEDFKVDETRSIKFVRFDVLPSSEDSAFYREDVEDLMVQFKTIEDDSVFAAINTDGITFFNEYVVADLPGNLQDQYSSLEEGGVYGPFLQGNNYVINKVSSIGSDTTRSARASHILIKWENETPDAKAAARAKAQGVLNQARSGESFEVLARQYGEDGTAVQGGDLGWFKTGAMVAPFQNAVFSSGKGLINRLVETQFGYHIIMVTEPVTNKTFKVATIEREILASDDTENKAFRKADYFAGTAGNLSEFEANVKADSIQEFVGTKLEKNQSDIAGLGAARQVVRWLFTEASKGEVSEVFEVDNSYVVAVMTQEQEEGTASLSDVRFQVESLVKQEKKTELIASQLRGLSGSLEEISSSYGEGATVYTQTGLLGNSTSLLNVGNAPEAIGTVFGLEAGERSSAVKTPTGIVMIEVDNIVSAAEIADYSSYRDQLLNQRSGRASYFISETIRDAADIKDDRYRFY